jgi:hypothetical protein
VQTGLLRARGSFTRSGFRMTPVFLGAYNWELHLNRGKLPRRHAPSPTPSPGPFRGPEPWTKRYVPRAEVVLVQEPSWLRARKNLGFCG